MNTHNITQLFKKLAVITGIVSVSAFATVPVRADNHGNMGNMQMSTSNRNLVEVAVANDSFETLVKAVQAAGLSDTLVNGSYTIFAPTDQAFEQSLPEGAVEFLLQPENRDLLRQVLSYHVVQGTVTSNQLQTGTVDTLYGGVAVRVTPERVIVNDASVTDANIAASNGVIHAVNRVLLPQQLRQAIASRLAMQ
ncbi:MAG: fasciclin domain-containing protein [Richelia sp. SL_2_1]|uniref:Fasciclin domain-containing protein n=1 Tax=Plectonema cf. radiosum LEGE 06105 TaxID=945769 RepID=A0A8J7F1H3_9CYAN|nr:fasciclin domain-containing protein [Plectonema radiosum]MBE9213077.1 fasciclin domain-containing protein [Plectonema cf. radiosum LEGE 06105]NJN09200.1 fasciclin domain-containing protein [Richelia sp. RM1_1_1]NJO28601.1 fasciclin domain-containing protein [Richelia sp. SL_2_1]